MRIDVLDYYAKQDWQLMKQEADRHPTPFLVVNLNIVKMKYEELLQHFPFSRIYYAVKANPATEVLELLRDLGSCFDIASRYELDEADLRNIAKEAPGARVFCRILTEGSETADWPLSRKFGCHPDMAIDLVLLARELGLQPWGISFHVGSQQRDIGAWDSAIAKVRYIFDYLEGEGLKLSMINMGGGFPANYISKTNEMNVYSEEITRYLEEDFGDDFPEIILEPGRSLVGECGILVSEVVLISQKSSMGVDKWLYLDTGKFNGLIETWDESIKYPLYCEARGEPCEDFIIAGPTCDSQDIMYEYFRNPVPAYIKPGDRIYWLSTGAYTSSYCSVEFNGFPPLPVYFVK